MDYVNEQTVKNLNKRKKRRLRWYCKHLGQKVPPNQKFFNIENQMSKAFKYYGS